MRTRRDYWILGAMWGLGGVVVGASSAALWIQGIEPDWVEATGTWIGGVATVLALLWAVQTFRADQAARENEIAAREADRVATAAATEAAVVNAASRVTMEIRGGGGYGPDGKKKMTTLHVYVHNDSAQTASILELDFDAPLQPKRLPAMPIRVRPGTTWHELIEINDIDAEASELSDAPVARFFGATIFLLDGRERRRSTTGELVRA